MVKPTINRTEGLYHLLKKEVSKDEISLRGDGEFISDMFEDAEGLLYEIKNKNIFLSEDELAFVEAMGYGSNPEEIINYKILKFNSQIIFLHGVLIENNKYVNYKH